MMDDEFIVNNSSFIIHTSDFQTKEYYGLDTECI
jgi:hypothetical protein